MALQSRELIDLLSIESVSVIGLLLFFIGYLIYQNKQIQLRHERDIEKHEGEKTLWFKEITTLRDEVLKAKDDAKNESNDFQEKYYTLASRLLTKMEIFSDVYRPKQ